MQVGNFSGSPRIIQINYVVVVRTIFYFFPICPHVLCFPRCLDAGCISEEFEADSLNNAKLREGLRRTDCYELGRRPTNGCDREMEMIANYEKVRMLKKARQQSCCLFRQI
ncbi:hypothetical protein Dimus_019644 [Dionaea muscipula]